MKEKQINPFEYNYDGDTKVEINGATLHALMMYLRQIEENETQVVFTHSYSSSAKEHKEGDIVTAIELENNNYPTMNSYMNQQAVKATSMIGVMAFDFLNTLSRTHLEAIETGKAKKQETFEIKTEENGTPLKLA